MVNPFEETMMAGRGSPHLDPADYTPHEPPGWNEYTDDAFVAPAGSPYFLPQDSSFNMSETFVEPTQQEGIVNWIGNKWDKEKSHLRNEFGIPRGSGPYMPTSREGITNLYNNLEFPKFSRTRNVLDQVGKGLHDTGKLYYDHGMFSDDILDFFGWQPQDNYYNESMNERFNEDYISEALEGIGKKANPYKGALPGAIMGDPFRYSSEDMAPNDWLADEIWGDQSKIDLNEIFRMYPDINIWRLIQNLDARGIEYANRGGIIGLL